MTPRFDDYIDKIRSLPANPTDRDVVTSDFLLREEGLIEVYYAPLHGITTDAKIVIVGITPSAVQMRAAFTEARRLLHEDMKPPHLFKEIRRRMAFKGPMRTNLNDMLDKIGVAERLGLASTTQLFDDASHLLHSTSALRYPVFNRGKNYTGSNPPIHRSPLLKSLLTSTLLPELDQVPDALIVPLGKAVTTDALKIIGFDKERRVLRGFPHPSGGNGHRKAQFQREFRNLCGIVRAWNP
ncbi:MAG: hypothetical protein F4X17_07890 [Gemmatimonadetes bacterium]|nr:hypothetical protein [Gemmatimonadota bacterium]MYI63738.1 hypothetical protein [Gemmatimonadota bacterium]